MVLIFNERGVGGFLSKHLYLRNSLCTVPNRNSTTSCVLFGPGKKASRKGYRPQLPGDIGSDLITAQYTLLFVSIQDSPFSAESQTCILSILTVSLRNGFVSAFGVHSSTPLILDQFQSIVIKLFQTVYFENLWKMSRGWNEIL